MRVGAMNQREERGWIQAWQVRRSTGVGIPAENLPHIFDRFYRVRNAQTNQMQGLGLGLSFVAWIVKAHGGQVEVTSTVGAGTRFSVRLPAEAPAGAAVNEEYPATVESRSTS